MSIEIGPIGDPVIDGKLKALRHIREHGLLCECAECNSRGGTAREEREKPYWILITENGRAIDSHGIDDPFIHTVIRPRGLKAALFVLLGWMEWRIHVTGSAESHRRIFGVVPLDLTAFCEACGRLPVTMLPPCHHQLCHACWPCPVCKQAAQFEAPAQDGNLSSDHP